MRSKRNYYVYILSSKHNGTLYVGVTNDLIRRISEHKQRKIAGFTNEYDVKQLVYFEEHDDVRDAIAREKKIKRWKRFWKIKLIVNSNPGWRDLFDDVSRWMSLDRI